ncbi:MAG TPA: aromatase/cyclase [Ktedonosporobacter sp.]|nr:aromatase/cyclase [Ktedonosporobacter sp.]
MINDRTSEVRCWRTRSIQDGYSWISTHHLITIARPVPQVFAIADDLPGWPEIFPPCQAIEILERQGGITRFRITALANERLVSWVSQRNVDKERYKVDFVQLEPFPPLAVMKGTWWFKEVSAGTLIDFVHHFTLASHDPELYSAELALCRAVDANSIAELSALRDVCEQSLERKEKGYAQL